MGNTGWNRRSAIELKAARGRAQNQASAWWKQLDIHLPPGIGVQTIRPEGEVAEASDPCPERKWIRPTARPRALSDGEGFLADNWPLRVMRLPIRPAGGALAKRAIEQGYLASVPRAYGARSGPPTCEGGDHPRGVQRWARPGTWQLRRHSHPRAGNTAPGAEAGVPAADAHRRAALVPGPQQPGAGDPHPCRREASSSARVINGQGRYAQR
jgi:hypothetical protein